MESRSRWRCGGCGRQLGLRAGTLMAGSRLPAAPWFAAIGLLMRSPRASTAELGEATGIRRDGTLRKMARAIRGAVGSESGSFLDEVACEFAEYDAENRTIKYRHTETKPDDTLHALNCVCVLGRHWLDAQQRLC